MEAATSGPNVLAGYMPANLDNGPLWQWYRMVEEHKKRDRLRGWGSPLLRNHEAVFCQHQTWIQNELDRVDEVMVKEEEEHKLQMFQQLEAFCVTDEAKESLWQFQELYRVQSFNQGE
jgi:hypothetical protein